MHSNLINFWPKLIVFWSRNGILAKAWPGPRSKKFYQIWSILINFFDLGREIIRSHPGELKFTLIGSSRQIWSKTGHFFDLTRGRSSALGPQKSPWGAIFGILRAPKRHPWTRPKSGTTCSFGGQVIKFDLNLIKIDQILINLASKSALHGHFSRVGKTLGSDPFFDGPEFWPGSGQICRIWSDLQKWGQNDLIFEGFWLIFGCRSGANRRQASKNGSKMSHFWGASFEIKNRKTLRNVVFEISGIKMAQNNT